MPFEWKFSGNNYLYFDPDNVEGNKEDQEQKKKDGLQKNVVIWINLKIFTEEVSLNVKEI